MPELTEYGFIRIDKYYTAMEYIEALFYKTAEWASKQSRPGDVQTSQPHRSRHGQERLRHDGLGSYEAHGSISTYVIWARLSPPVRFS